jgi:hypothetical protein
MPQESQPQTFGQMIYEILSNPANKKPCDPKYLRDQVHMCLMAETEIGNCAQVVDEYRSCLRKIDKPMS